MANQYWKVELSDFLHSNGRNLEMKDDLNENDIENFVSSFEGKYKPKANFDTMVNYAKKQLGFTIPKERFWSVCLGKEEMIDAVTALLIKEKRFNQEDKAMETIINTGLDKLTKADLFHLFYAQGVELEKILNND
jgi:hypothetical protein